MIDVQEKPRMVEKAFLLSVHLKGESKAEAKDLLEELEELVTTLGIGIVGSAVVEVREWKARLLIGTGKADEILEQMKAVDADCLVIDNELSPAQQRNWESFSKCTCIDRQEVILDIFGSRAQTKEAKLQVELARMEYNLPRLKKAWSHLGRQSGGGGGGGAAQKGEGEQQIELDRRMVRDRISALKKELKVVRANRAIQRKERSRVPLPHAAVVGYTNAGKSSLLQALSGSKIYVANKLFATLDTTTRRIELPNGRPLLVTDTVGFVRNLPHGLVDAFKATLEEAILADFLIHVLDVTAPQVEAFHETTLKVLGELGADQKRMITVFNKIDLLPDNARKLSLLQKHPDAIFLSTHSREGLQTLEERLSDQLADQVSHVHLQIPHSRGDVVALLHEQAKVNSSQYEDEAVYIDATVPKRLEDMLESWIIPK
ncbi:GTPase HflX [Kiritimatiellaeota bacterium B1221]|nr:GTPase HflX [Kiritimatiellaeota bacterium B1221]